MASTPYRIAFLTDIHGNLHGLAAVLDAIRRAAPDLILVGAISPTSSPIRASRSNSWTPWTIWRCAGTPNCT